MCLYTKMAASNQRYGYRIVCWSSHVLILSPWNYQTRARSGLYYAVCACNWQRHSLPCRRGEYQITNFLSRWPRIPRFTISYVYWHPQPIRLWKVYIVNCCLRSAKHLVVSQTSLGPFMILKQLICLQIAGIHKLHLPSRLPVFQRRA